MSIESTDAGRITLSELATQAGVSLSTASKVLNGRSDVSESTRSKVEALFEEHGYMRRGSPVQRSTFVEVVFHELESAWAMEIITGAERAARAHGMSIVLTESGDRQSPGDEWISGVLQRRPAGVVLVFSDLAIEHKKQLRSRSIPFVIVDPAGDPSPDVPSVGSANWSGGLAATRHLIELGHTRIAAITGPADLMCSRARLDGYHAAMGAAELAVDPTLIAWGDFHVEGARTIALSLLKLEEPPTAIFAGSDLQALGVYDAARTLGVRIPHDLSVVGYDDVQLAKWTSPPLTTIHQPLRDMAETAVRIVLEPPNASGPPVRMDLATSLVVRQSTAPPAASTASTA